MILSPVWWFWQAVLNFSHLFKTKEPNKKFQLDNNILVYSNSDWGNCWPYVLVPPLLSCKSGRYVTVGCGDLETGHTLGMPKLVMQQGILWVANE